MMKKIAIMAFLGCLTMTAVVVTLHSIAGGNGKEIAEYKEKIAENARKIIKGVEVCQSRPEQRPDWSEGSNSDPILMSEIQKIRDLVRGIMKALGEISSRLGDISGDKKIILTGYLKLVGDAAEEIDNATGKARTGMGIKDELKSIKECAQTIIKPVK
jgi:hypothetical protein